MWGMRHIGHAERWEIYVAESHHGDAVGGSVSEAANDAEPDHWRAQCGAEGFDSAATNNPNRIHRHAGCPGRRLGVA